jgi:hypothetical protein
LQQRVRYSLRTGLFDPAGGGKPERKPAKPVYCAILAGIGRGRPGLKKQLQRSRKSAAT